jgi:hypothetical protein
MSRASGPERRSDSVSADTSEMTQPLCYITRRLVYLCGLRVPQPSQLAQAMPLGFVAVGVAEWYVCCNIQDVEK